MRELSRMERIADKVLDYWEGNSSFVEAVGLILVGAVTIIILINLI